MLPRADRLKEPPVVGRWYMVPCVHATWNRNTEEWPVIGPLHDDVQFFNFPHKHYHVDARFLTVRQQMGVVGYSWDRNDPKFLEYLAGQCMGSPLQTNDRGCNPDGLPKPILSRKRCSFDAITTGARITGGPEWRGMERHYAGHQCSSSKRGWICPHQKVPLGAVKPIDGVIHCPLHGLRIDSATGKCLGEAA